MSEKKKTLEEKFCELRCKINEEIERAVFKGHELGTLEFKARIIDKNDDVKYCQLSLDFLGLDKNNGKLEIILYGPEDVL